MATVDVKGLNLLSPINLVSKNHPILFTLCSLHGLAEPQSVLVLFLESTGSVLSSSHIVVC